MSVPRAMLVFVDGTRGQRLLGRVTAGITGRENPITHVAELPVRTAVCAPWPSWATPEVVKAFRACGVEAPWTHQAEAAEHAYAGRHVVISTGTASGKSLAYQLPVLSRLAAGEKVTALYLAPTKALGADQLRAVSSLDVEGARTVALWEPPLLEELTGEHGAPVRRSAGAETSRILADLVVEGARSLAFIRSRRGAELAALGARRLLSEVDPRLAETVAAYRSGYLPEERRALEAALLSGRLLGVATTNALELGVDIAGLDAVVLAG